MAMVRILMSLATIALVLGSAVAANHTVGAPNGGWDQSADLKTWAASETFVVGDSLIFAYTPNHDVLEVTKADYDSCQTTNAISTNGGGMTVIPLSSSGKRYFICGTGGHCASGMKLEVNTLATVPPPTSAPAKSPASSSSPKSSAPTPKIAPKISPVSSPKNAPKISPATSPDASSPSPITVEAPSVPPNNDSVPTSSQPSSADKISVVASSTMGFGVVVMMLFFM
ncbi:uclacyanin 1 [Lycium barbarum]|uniref:uclacyanin 1 n=1 Tax=Lycium barbarum TaxID=112863 RepID=UPI00293EDBA3|nr:uclacyanin 1 [Lycium barbarum]